MSRSRQGCQRCRIRRRRCDEARPFCARCVRNGVPCSYTKNLSWGGRPFAKSSFGGLVGREVKVVATDHLEPEAPSSNGFVYGTCASTPNDCLTSLQSCHGRLPDDGSGAVNKTTLLSRESAVDRVPHSIVPCLHPTPWLTYDCRLLVDHFINCTTLATSCHDHIRTLFCSLLLPRALESLPLFSALLCLAAIHRQSIGLDQSPVQIAHLRWNTIRLLRSTLTHGTSKSEVAAAATSLLLCFCDVFAGVENTESLTLHWRGSGIILTRCYGLGILDSDPLSTILSRNEDANLLRFLRQWYVSMGFLAMMNGPLWESEMKSTIFIPSSEDRHVIDEFLGFSSDLVPVFAQIRSLAESPDSQTAIQKGRDLARDIMSTLTRTEDHPAKFRWDIQSYIDDDAAAEYALLDKAYHHVALILIHTNVLKQPINKLAVQHAVQYVITYISRMRFRNGPCPAVALVYPLFYAGSAAYLKAHREEIMDLLSKLDRRLGAGNVKSSMKRLERTWSREQM